MSSLRVPDSGRPGPALEAAAAARPAGRFDEAERLAAPMAAAHATAAQILGIARLSLGRPADAIGPLSAAAGQGRDPAIETWLARALAADGRRDEALDQWRRASERRPAYPPAFLELADALSASGHLDEAAAALEAGLALLPAADGFRVALGYVHLKRNDRAGARKAFEHVRRAAPSRQDAMVGLAQVLSLDGDYARAAELYRRALAIRPDNVGARIGLGRCLLEAGDRPAGEAALRQAVQEAPEVSGPAILALSAVPHGRIFLRRSAAQAFLRR